MIIRTLSVALLCLFVPVAGIGAQGKVPKEPTALEDNMEEINAAYRRLGRQVKDPAKNADSLKRIAIIREHAMSALKLEPVKKTDLPAAEQAKFVADYHGQMEMFIVQVGKLEDALKAGKNADAVEVLKALKQAQADGHKEFRRKKMTFQEKAAAAAERNAKFNAEINSSR